MTRLRRPPALVVRTTAVTFVTAAALLSVTFVVVLASVRGQVRTTVVRNLAASQRMFAAAQGREQRALRLQVANLAESPTLKAAVDTYAAEAPGAVLACQCSSSIRSAARWRRWRGAPTPTPSSCSTRSSARWPRRAAWLAPGARVT